MYAVPSDVQLEHLPAMKPTSIGPVRGARTEPGAPALPGAAAEFAVDPVELAFPVLADVDPPSAAG